MAKSRVGGTTDDVSLGADQVTLTWPGGLAAGDFAVVTASWYENGDNTELDNPSGFTPFAASSVLDGSGLGESRFRGWYKELTGSESGSLVVGRPANLGFYMTAILDIYRGDGALTFASASVGTPAIGTTATAPDVAGSNGQILLALFGSSDPTTMSTPTDMSIGQQGDQAVNTGRNFYEFLTGDPGAKSTTLGTRRANVGISVLVNDAGAGGGARKIILTRPA
jgi:hypothetical protein